jgi:hypothetical protein
MAGMLVGGPYDGDPMKLVNPITGVPRERRVGSGVFLQRIERGDEEATINLFVLEPGRYPHFETQEPYVTYRLASDGDWHFASS